MDYRHAHLLKGLIEEYIATGRPVGSERLLDVLDVSVSSATIRSMLRLLEDEGYILQPHTSAGRIPSDTGYRYYIDQLSFKEPSEKRVRALTDTYKEYQEEYARPARAAAKMLAEMAHTMAVGGWMHDKDIQGAGMSQVFDDDENQAQEAAREISLLFDNIERYAHEFADTASRAVTVYIGSENPIFETEHTSIIVKTMRLPTGEAALLLLAGPKRMPYKRNVALLNALSSIIEQI
ncbi:MAG: hypothetical protein O3A36_00740 [bacterium]|nr:hypothetical protein [bacterium]